jgi:hypothetical protein
MRDLVVDLVYLSLIIYSFGICYHRCTLLSHRIDMIIMIQQSQQIDIDKLSENK